VWYGEEKSLWLMPGIEFQIVQLITSTVLNRFQVGQLSLFITFTYYRYFVNVVANADV
jgi:hypothetical protein